LAASLFLGSCSFLGSSRGISCRGIGGRHVGRGRGICDRCGLLVLVGILGMAVDKLNTDLLGEGKLNGLASRGSKLGDTLLEGLGDILNLRDGDALLLGQVLAADSGQADGLVDTGLDGLGVCDLNGGINNGDYGNVVASLLGNLLAVVVTVSLVAITVSVGSGLADSHHLCDALLLEADLNSLGGGVLALLLVAVGADLVVNLLDGLGADGSGDGVALLNINNSLSYKLNWAADSLEGRGADLSDLNDISDSAVVLGALICRCVVVGRGGMVGGGGMVSRSGMVSGGGVVSRGSMMHWGTISDC